MNTLGFLCPHDGALPGCILCYRVLNFEPWLGPGSASFHGASPLVVLYPEKLTFGWTIFRGAGQPEQRGSDISEWNSLTRLRIDGT
jgi:hypothetical protein